MHLASSIGLYESTTVDLAVIGDRIEKNVKKLRQIKLLTVSTEKNNLWVVRLNLPGAFEILKQLAWMNRTEERFHRARLILAEYFGFLDVKTLNRLYSETVATSYSEEVKPTYQKDKTVKTIYKAMRSVNKNAHQRTVLCPTPP